MNQLQPERQHEIYAGKWCRDSEPQNDAGAPDVNDGGSLERCTANNTRDADLIPVVNSDDETCGSLASGARTSSQLLVKVRNTSTVGGTVEGEGELWTKFVVRT